MELVLRRAIIYYSIEPSEQMQNKKFKKYFKS